MIDALLTMGVSENNMTYYSGVMGVPITFLDKYNPEQFELVGCSYSYGRPVSWNENTNMTPTINRLNVYKRLLIKKKIRGDKQ